VQEIAVMKSPAFQVMKFSPLDGVAVYMREHTALIIVLIRRSRIGEAAYEQNK
jgi:hypothetical protein